MVLPSPIAWHIMNEWLQALVYNVTISWQVFTLTTGLAIPITILTISFHAIKAAMASPVKILGQSKLLVLDHLLEQQPQFCSILN